MISHKTTYRIIYGDTDKMGIAYHANYLRWFEMGRAEMFRNMGMSYNDIEAKGILLPVSEVYCKYMNSARYDDLILIKTSLDTSVKAAMKFDYLITRELDQKTLVKGYTKHACTTPDARVVRPPRFLTQLIENYKKTL